MSDHESTYVPKSGIEKWFDSRLPIIRFGADYMSLPTPKNLNYWWTFGGILALCLVVQNWPSPRSSASCATSTAAT
jgi:ubiquinol-cytochrome c reductase cytochrome b subunit